LADGNILANKFFCNIKSKKVNRQYRNRDFSLSEKKELLNMLRARWRNGDSSLRRIYPSWEDLEAHLEITTEQEHGKDHYSHKLCPNCGVTQKIIKPLNELFPYEKCRSCKRPFHVNKDLTVRKLTEDEEENMPVEWVRILEDLNKKKLAIVFRLE
jgi:predicted RNA-binding Zn-ribbon protein involved in translation (DUF1610 family)